MESENGMKKRWNKKASRKINQEGRKENSKREWKTLRLKRRKTLKKEEAEGKKEGR